MEFWHGAFSFGWSSPGNRRKVYTAAWNVVPIGRDGSA